MKKEYSKQYFAHILLNRLETHDRNSEELRFFRPTLFKKMYRYGNRDFVNDILIPHMDSLRIYYYKNNKTISVTEFKDVDSLFVEDSQLKITINKQREEFTVATPIGKEREIDTIDNFKILELDKNDLSKATIDHFPSLIEHKNLCKQNKKFEVLFNYQKGIRKDAKDKNDKLIAKLQNESNLIKLWEELILFYNDSKIELVQSRYNKREG